MTFGKKRSEDPAAVSTVAAAPTSTASPMELMADVDDGLLSSPVRRGRKGNPYDVIGMLMKLPVLVTRTTAISV